MSMETEKLQFYEERCIQVDIPVQQEISSDTSNPTLANPSESDPVGSSDEYGDACEHPASLINGSANVESLGTVSDPNRGASVSHCENGNGFHDVSNQNDDRSYGNGHVHDPANGDEGKLGDPENGQDGTEELDDCPDGAILARFKLWTIGTKMSCAAAVPLIVKNKERKKSGSAAEFKEGAGDTMDANPARSSGVPPMTTLPSAFFSNRYAMNHARRGVAVIINNREFKMKDTPSRKGSDNDAKEMQEVLLRLGFQVEYYQDLHGSDMLSCMKHFGRVDHTDADCFFCAIFSHGEEGVIFATDCKVNLSDLTAPFNGDRCLTLAGKPKIFVINACRGDKLDNGVDLVEADAGGTYRIPAEADFLYAFSTVSGYFSWRNTETGSWFIQCLCRTLSDHASNPDMDLLRILTRVNYEVAVVNESNVPQDQKWHRKKQIPSTVSMLTKDLFFTPKPKNVHY